MRLDKDLPRSTGRTKEVSDSSLRFRVKVNLRLLDEKRSSGGAKAGAHNGNNLRRSITDLHYVRAHSRHTVSKLDRRVILGYLGIIYPIGNFQVAKDSGD